MDAAIDERTARAKRLNVQRVKRHRERKANGGCCFNVDLDGSDVAALVKLGVLAEDRRSDRDAVRAAVLKLFVIGYRTARSSDGHDPRRTG
jgi:hypothetical protein